MSEWISVKTALPPPDKDVLVVDYHGQMHVAVLFNYENKPLKWLRCGPKLRLDEVTHYMPLPPRPDEP